MQVQNLCHKKMQMQIKQYYIHVIVRLWINCMYFGEDSDTEDE